MLSRGRVLSAECRGVVPRRDCESTGIYGCSIQEHCCFVGGRFGRRLWQYLPSGVVNDWIYLEIYVDLLSKNKSSCKIYLEKIYIN